MSNEQSIIINIGLVERPDPPVRDHFDEVELGRLVSSIRDEGILVPLLVRPKGDKFEVVDGDRRLKAAWEAGLREIPVLVRDLDDSQTHIHRMLANLDRHDPDPVSEAKYIAHIIASEIMTMEVLAQKLGRTMAWIEGRLTIAEMPPYMQEALSTQQMSLGVAMELHQIKEENTKERYFREAVRNGMTVHAAKLAVLQVNETIQSLQDQGQDVTPDVLPDIQAPIQVQCMLSGELVPLDRTRMIRVSIDNYNKFLRIKSESPAASS